MGNMGVFFIYLFINVIFMLICIQFIQYIKTVMNELDYSKSISYKHGLQLFGAYFSTSKKQATAGYEPQCFPHVTMLLCYGSTCHTLTYAKVSLLKHTHTYIQYMWGWGDIERKLILLQISFFLIFSSNLMYIICFFVLSN